MGQVLYPEYSAGSLSSSGVVNAILSFPEFDQQVSAAVGSKCADQIRRIQAAFERANESPRGYEESLQMFNCKPRMLLNDFYFMIAGESVVHALVKTECVLIYRCVEYDGPILQQARTMRHNPCSWL
jgi:hypothetical protein